MRLTLGKHMIQNILDPKPEEIDLDAIPERLRVMHRFSNDPTALTVYQHRNLVCRLVELDKKRGFGDTPTGHKFWLALCEWAKHHDDHEAFIGDIPGPIKNIIGLETPVLRQIEDRLDRAICSARRVPFPDREVREAVHAYDKAAETVEWVYHMGQTRSDWNAPTPPGMNEGTLKLALQDALSSG